MAILTAIKFDRLSLFSFIWAVASLMHVMSFPGEPSVLFSYLLAAAAMLVIVNPQSNYFFMLMLAISIIRDFQWLPFTPNHILFELIINVGILLTLMSLYFKYVFTRGASEEIDVRNTIFNSFAPFVRISLLILYFYAVLHKLNWDYFNPDISCGPFLLVGFGSRLPDFVLENNAIRVGAVWGTLIIEAAIPVFFLFKKTRSAGIFLGLIFHYFLSVHPHTGLFSFSSLLFGLYCLFIPQDFPEKLMVFAHSLLGDNWRWRVKAFRVFFVAIVAVVLLLILSGFESIFKSIFKSGLLIWLFWGLMVIVIYAAVYFKYKFREDNFHAMYKLRSPIYWVIPLIVFLNGLSPYLGLKTQTSFSMFSNLRTEGGITNHLFMPVSLHVTNLQEDLVQITNTNYEGFNFFLLNHKLITFFEFHRIASKAKKDFFVEYKRNGKLQKLLVKDRVSSNPDITKPINFWAYKFISFRPIDKGPCLCKH